MVKICRHAAVGREETEEEGIRFMEDESRARMADGAGKDVDKGDEGGQKSEATCQKTIDVKRKAYES